MGDYNPSEQSEIRADIEDMYRAGSRDLPEKAAQMAAVADAMRVTIGDVYGQLETLGFYSYASDIVAMMKDCQAGAVRSVETLNDIGAAVIAIANDFAERDAYASSVIAGLDEELRVGNTPQPVPESVPSEYEESPFGGTMPGGN
jgi:hypothetical protein